MTERIIVTITSDLFDEVNQEASVRRNISIRTLLNETLREFSLPEGNYSFRHGNRVLDLDKTIEQLNIQHGAQLLFNRERRSAGRPAGRSSATQPLSGTNEAYLRAESGQIFEITWQPAIIGRPDASNPASAAQLAVDLSNFEEAKSVSRRHAAITERRGNYFLESLSEQNLAEINDDPVEYGERRRLSDGDEILIGKIRLTFKIRGTPGAEKTKSGQEQAT